MCDPLTKTKNLTPSGPLIKKCPIYPTPSKDFYPLEIKKAHVWRTATGHSFNETSYDRAFRPYPSSSRGVIPELKETTHPTYIYITIGSNTRSEWSGGRALRRALWRSLGRVRRASLGRVRHVVPQEGPAGGPGGGPWNV